jgi:chorismate mutase
MVPAPGAVGEAVAEGSEGQPAQSRGVVGVAVRAVRGAIQIDRNERQEILDGAAQLLLTILERNQLTSGNLISVIFTLTPDLSAEFPAYAARQLGITDVPLLCATEIDVPGAMPRVLRLMAHVETDQPRAAIHHVYLRGAAALRTDLPQ